MYGASSMTEGFLPLPPPPKLPPRRRDPLSDAMYEIADCLTYPKDSRGRTYDVRFMLPVLAYHLARCGCVMDPDRAVIKKRMRPSTPGVIEDAVDWVPVDAPDSIEDELAGATIADIERLSPAAKAVLLRRLGGEPEAADPQDLDAAAPWHVETSIHFDDRED